MRSVAEPVAAELAERTFAVIECGSDLAATLHDARSAWAELFDSEEKFLQPGDVSVPSGYVPLCLAGGCDLKESFYLRPENPPPEAVAEASRALVARLGDVAVAVAASLRGAAGRPLVQYPAAGCLRVMHYPAFEGGPQADLMRALERDGAIRTLAHTDLNAITVLTASTAPGLEIRTDDGWTAVEVEPDEVLVHVGQELEADTDRRWRATEHRVRNPIAEERSAARLSFAYFVS